MSVGVVGGGILGASIAMHLAKSGAQVTLFEKSAPATGATSKSFAWINAFSTNPHYRALRLKSISAYLELDEPLQLGITWGGAIHWAENLAEAQTMQAETLEFNNTGYSARLVTAQDLQRLSPNLQLGPFHVASFHQLDGHVDPVHATGQLLQKAKEYGARVVYPCEVNELGFDGDRFTGVATTKGNYSLDRLVIAGGVDTPSLASQTGYTPPLIHAPGILVHTKPTEALLDQVVEAPQMYFKQHRDGRIVGNDGSYAPDIPAHQGILHGPQDMPAELRDMHGLRILAKIKEKLPGARDATYDHLTLGYRPMPEDGLPVAGFSPGNPNVYIAVMHSGVTLAPIMGRYIAQEVTTNQLVDDLAPYRPDRF